jgi:hypothetical protein
VGLSLKYLFTRNLYVITPNNWTQATESEPVILLSSHSGRAVLEQDTRSLPGLRTLASNVQYGEMSVMLRMSKREETSRLQ